VALLVVRDEGSGIERADLERVFRPFTRLDGHERVPGTGLGLPISRDLARAMGGDVAVASVPASGSSFIVGLPAVAEVPRAAITAAINATSDAEEIELEERAILRALRADGRAGDRRGKGRDGASAPATRGADGRSGRGEAPAIDAA
jgi:nitrogen-specific signal transduction histidine kinase